ncbi:hypothetical protein QTO34_012532 [Cnephaeus nilssonii]|uniref:Serologically defined colon cancer antigen 8 n=1 Tax=Cnephaeus nilssonii TaxID=3371016 RepID=A0AA40LDH3_CNENI|nr:hypothetical protein QTO34_012532 [Eptesicus nilssonii]
MEKPPENSILEETLGQYQRSLRERVNRSLHQLSCVLREDNAAFRDDALDPSFSAEGGNEDTGTAWHELQHSHAVNQLMALLYQQAAEESEVSPSRRRKMSSLRSSEYEETSMPTVHNLVPIINDQSQYIHHLEAEVKFCKEELSGMKNRVQVVVLDNERLQQELKARGQEEAMREQTLLDASGNMQNSWMTRGEDSGVQEAVKAFSHGDADMIKTSSAGEAEKWKLELEKLKLTYEQKCEILESQLRVLRKNLAECQKNCEDLKERLKHKESVLAAQVSNPNRVGGLCVKCAQHEAVLSQTHSDVHMQTIERLTKAPVSPQVHAQQMRPARCPRLPAALPPASEDRGPFSARARCVRGCRPLSSDASSGLFLPDLGMHGHLGLSRFECPFCADRERDDLMSALVAARSSLADVQLREAGAYEQVKCAMQMTEEANLEKTKASPAGPEPGRPSRSLWPPENVFPCSPIAKLFFLNTQYYWPITLFITSPCAFRNGYFLSLPSHTRSSHRLSTVSWAGGGSGAGDGHLELPDLAQLPAPLFASRGPWGRDGARNPGMCPDRESNHDLLVQSARKVKAKHPVLYHHLQPIRPC